MVPRTLDRNAFGLEIKKTKNKSAMMSIVIPVIIKPLTNGIQSRETNMDGNKDQDTSSILLYLLSAIIR